MKLIRFGNPGEEKPGLQLADGRNIDASGFGADYDEAFFGGDGLVLARAVGLFVTLFFLCSDLFVEGFLCCFY